MINKFITVKILVPLAHRLLNLYDVLARLDEDKASYYQERKEIRITELEAIIKPLE